MCRAFGPWGWGGLVESWVPIAFVAAHSCAKCERMNGAAGRARVGKSAGSGDESGRLVTEVSYGADGDGGAG